MNPSYNSGSGSNAGGQNNIGAPGTKPGVIASGPDSEDAPATPISIPVASKESSRSKISSLLGKRKSSASTGGSVISPMGSQPMQLSGNSGKPKKGLIFGGLAVIVILIIALVVGMTMGGKGGGNGDIGTTSLVSPTTIQKQFNSFYYYLTNNDPNNTKDVTIKDLARASFYIDNADLTTAQRDKFLDAFNDEMAKFIEVYSGTSGGQPLDNLYAYVYALHKINETTASELYNIYSSEGVAAARKRLADVYKDYDSDGLNSLLEAYTFSEHEYLTAFIDSLETGDRSGIEDKQTTAIQARDNLRLAAYHDLEYLYSEVYGKNLNEGVSV